MLLKYIDEVGKDLVLDDFNIKEQSMRLPARKHYWVAQLIKSKISRNATFEKKKQLKKNIMKLLGNTTKFGQNKVEEKIYLR